MVEPSRHKENIKEGDKNNKKLYVDAKSEQTRTDLIPYTSSICYIRLLMIATV